jgi:general stress protein YciG
MTNLDLTIRSVAYPLLPDLGTTTLPVEVASIPGAPRPGRGGGQVAKEDRGFKSMDRSKQREIASKGGKAAHQKGTAHEWTSDEAREAGRKGGMASQRRKQSQQGEPGGASASAEEMTASPDLP